MPNDKGWPTPLLSFLSRHRGSFLFGSSSTEGIGGSRDVDIRVAEDTPAARQDVIRLARSLGKQVDVTFASDTGVAATDAGETVYVSKLVVNPQGHAIEDSAKSENLVAAGGGFFSSRFNVPVYGAGGA